MIINSIIIEDEPLAQERLAEFVSRVPNIKLLKKFDNGIEAVSFLKANNVDLIFLDINMDGFSGIQLLESTKINGQVIFTTAYDEYALKSYDLNVTDYLLKPFTFERFMKAIAKVDEKLTPNAPKDERDYLFVKTEYRLEKVMLDDILFIEGMRDYRRIHTKDRKIMTLQTFKDFEQEISKTKVCRVHKSYMVAIDKITSIERERIKVKDVLIPISETYKKDFLEIINRGSK
ncbi:MAG: response regulator transcription factor [Bacteroidetes bacterium]|nr:response regulator transcription factor [Bacteroidota bacterium]